MAISDLLLVGLLGLVIVPPANAQSDSSVVATRTPLHRVELKGWGNFSSNVIGDDLVLGLYKGGFLDRDLRLRTADRLKNRNRGGYEFGVSATYTWGKEGRLASRITVAHNSLMGLRFAPDVYRLTFFGNKDHVDRIAELGPSAFEQLTFQRLSYGIENRETGSFVELGLVNGKSLHKGTIRRGDLYTALDGRYLDLGLDADYQLSDTSGQRSPNGLGVVIDLRHNVAITLWGQQAVLAFTANDLGFVAWNARSLALHVDSTINISGFEVANILDLHGLTVNEHSIQDSLGLGYEAGSILLPTPAKIGVLVGFGRQQHDVWGMPHNRYTLAVNQRFIPGYSPEITFGLGLGLSELGQRGQAPDGERLLIRVNLGYGGFGELHSRVDLRGFLGNHWAFNLGSDQYFGRGIGAQAGVSYSW